MSIQMNFDREKIEQLIYRHLANDTLPEENAELEAVIRESSEARQLWDQLNAAYILYEAGNEIDALDSEAAWEKIKTRVQQQPKIRYIKRWMAAAACLLLLGTGILTYKFLNGRYAGKSEFIELSLANGKTIRLESSEQTLKVQNGQDIAVQLSNGRVLANAQKETIDVNAFNKLAIPHGKEYHLQLSDGTEVWLNAVTELQFPLAFTGNIRKVKIKGEAYFKVAHDAGRPFVVETLQGDVRVMGTEFNVKNYPGEVMATSLINGSIYLNPLSGEGLKLEPGQTFITDKSNNSHIGPFNEIETLGWMKGLYYFNNSPLEEIRGVVERWYNVRVTFKEGHGDKRFTGVLEKDKPLSLFLNNISVSSGIPFNFSDTTVSF